ncbi:prolyl 3-hydroxylase OGFOD1 [Ceratina calcarata]|uniref:uS12 prolyl 3-hydroxylase n=1 Tax=Ceratina calcarata TaxID=156304 RepID=A0AAJ7J983_9HYME|nr:prolyl 3-hydroxylase OGFOD1 [Ceratina calcarata]
MAEEEPQEKKFKHSVISDFILSAEFQQIFREHWHNFTDIKTDDLEIISKPFRVCRISNFISSEEVMEEIKNDLLDIRTRRNSIDLYQFEQTDDFASFDAENIKLLYDAFQTDFATWLEENTKIELNKMIDMSSSSYYDTDFLLCHDDNLGDRRIAYVLYISKQWTEEDGGTLDLFDTDEDGLPRDVVKSLVPEYNSIVFFEVVDNSYHQVAEIISPDKSRWSINGWFHGPKQSTKQPRPEMEPDCIPSLDQTVNLDEWVTECYLFSKVKEDIHMDMEKDSYTHLSSFLKDEIYEKLATDLMSETIVWKKVGPADIRKYEVADEDTLPDLLKQLCTMFKSITMFKLLKEYTELDLVAEKENMNPRMFLELQRWSGGCYTLIHDKPILSDYNEDPKSLASESDESEALDETEGDGLQLLNKSTREDQEKSNSNNRSSSSDCGTPVSIRDETDDIEDEIMRKILKSKSPRTRRKYLVHHAAMLKMGDRSPRKPRILDTDESDVSDIGDYLSDPLECSLERSDEEEVVKPEEVVPTKTQPTGSLDLILQFHANNAPQDESTICYLDPMTSDATLMNIPPKDNHLSIVYKVGNTCRIHRYVNHYHPDYFYNLICTYYE